MQLKDKVALVTGAGSGLGRASALTFAREGAKVGLLDIDEESLEQVSADIAGEAKGESLVLKADVSRVEAVQAAYEQLIDRWGRLDIVFANAGINGVWAPLEELDPEEWDKTVQVNLRGTYLTVKYAVPHLKVRGGAVVITASVNGTRMFSNTGATAYACTKAAQVAFTKMVALELAEQRIRVNVICPGRIATQISAHTQKEDLAAVREPVHYPEGKIPLTDGEAGTPKQVADLVLFLVSDASSHITGTEVWIDGGQSLIQG